MTGVIGNPVAEIGKFDGIIEMLLIDRTTESNVMWATEERTSAPIDISDVHLIEPRFMKERQRQNKRTKNRAEVFTPPNICQIQNQIIIKQLQNQSIENIVDYKFLEIACGEAPYLSTRYDVTNGDEIDINQRVGLLDFKLRNVNQNVDDHRQWLDYARRAFQSVYGYEFQGDNLLIARCNLLLTANDYYQQKFHQSPPKSFIKQLACIITWNLWQFDGINECLPFNDNAVGLFNACTIRDWRTRELIEFPSLAAVGNFDIEEITP